MKANSIVKGADRYIVGEVERFDQKNEMFKRAMWDPSQLGIGRKYYSPKDYAELLGRSKLSSTFEDAALTDAAWHLEREFAQGNRGGKQGLFAWETNRFNRYKRPANVKLTVDDPAKMTRYVKRVDTFFGASLVGVCELDKRWLYSHHYDTLDPAHPQHAPLEMPEEYKYFIAIASEMDYEAISRLLTT